jgi:hypothetical protein
MYEISFNIRGFLPFSGPANTKSGNNEGRLYHFQAWASADFFPKKHTIFLKKVETYTIFARPWPARGEQGPLLPPPLWTPMS